MKIIFSPEFSGHVYIGLNEQQSEPEETYVPLYFKKELLPETKTGTLLRGFLWMQGKIID